jgi:hypothetical protein
MRELLAVLQLLDRSFRLLAAQGGLAVEPLKT